MRKNIILCSDGTANAGGNGDITNVWRIYNAIDMQERNDLQQVAMHDDGVGTQRVLPIRILGLMFGFGLKRNVRDLYHFLIRNYDPNQDCQIYIFGFSRGAYTARILAELICLCGIINPKGKTDQQINQEIKEAFEILTESILNSSENSTLAGRWMVKISRWLRRVKLINQKEFIQTRSYPIKLQQGKTGETKYLIRFLGVWDTVPAYGFPVQFIADRWNKYIYPYKFSDRRVHPYIRQAAHALALDEERETFRPMLFDQCPDKNIGLPQDRIDQVWFPGVHANVGGGYPRDGLALLSLDWMMDKAEQMVDGETGLQFNPTIREEYTTRINPYAKMYNSRAGIAVLYRYQPRNIEELSKENGIDSHSQKLHRGVRIHPSVLKRVSSRTERYAPGNIPPNSILENHSSNSKLEQMMRDYREEVQNNFVSGFANAVPLIKLRESLQHFKIVGLVLLLLYLILNYFLINADENSWLANSSIFSECKNGSLSKVSYFLQTLLPDTKVGGFIHSYLIDPIVSCDLLFFIVFLSGFGLWIIGYKFKELIIENHANFWRKFL